MSEIKPGRLTISSLALSRSTLTGASLISSILLIEIAQSFGKTVGETSQILTFYAILGTITAVGMIFLSVRNSPTRLQNIGLGICVITSIGCYLAPSYSVFLIVYSLCSVGGAIITPMTSTIVGELYSGKERSKNLGIVFTGIPLFYAIGYLVVGRFSDWRNAFAYFAIPLMVLSLLLSLKAVPYIQPRKSGESFFTGLRAVLKNRSAVWCVLSSSLSSVWIICGGYIPSMYREVFEISVSRVAILTASLILFNAVSSFYGGRIIPRFGNKRVTAFCNIGTGTLFIIVLSVRNLYISLAGSLLVCILAGVQMSAGSGLNLSQVPDYKSSMMSVFSATARFGGSLNFAVMGYLLSTYRWSTAGLGVGGLGILSGLLILLFVEDPLRQ